MRISMIITISWWSLRMPALWAALGTLLPKVHMDLAIVDKRRQKANFCEVMNVIGDVKGKTCILFDDLVDTAGSLCNAAAALVEVGGAEKVYACASHGVLSGPALERVENSYIEELMVLNTIPMPAGYTGGRSSSWMWPPCLPRPSTGSTRRPPSPACSDAFFKAIGRLADCGLGQPRLPVRENPAQRRLSGGWSLGKELGMSSGSGESSRALWVNAPIEGSGWCCCCPRPS